MTFKCNICQTLLRKTGEPVCCPTCGMKFWPYENPK